MKKKTYIQHVLDVWRDDYFGVITFTDARGAYMNAPTRSKPYRLRHTSTNMNIGRLLKKYGTRFYVDNKPRWRLNDKFAVITEPQQCICGKEKHQFSSPDGVCGYDVRPGAPHYDVDCVDRVWFSNHVPAKLLKLTLREATLLKDLYIESRIFSYDLARFNTVQELLEHQNSFLED